MEEQEALAVMWDKVDREEFTEVTKYIGTDPPVHILINMDQMVQLDL